VAVSAPDPQRRAWLSQLDRAELDALSAGFPDVFGHPFAQAFVDLSCVQRQLAVGGAQNTALERLPQRSASRRRLRRAVAAAVKLASRCFARFLTADSGEAGTSSMASDSRLRFERTLARIAPAVEARGLSGVELEHRLTDAARSERALLSSGFPALFGLPYMGVFSPLSCIREQLGVADAMLGDDSGLLSHGPARARRYLGDRTQAALAAARRCGHELRAQLPQTASVTPTSGGQSAPGKPAALVFGTSHPFGINQLLIAWETVTQVSPLDPGNVFGIAQTNANSGSPHEYVAAFNYVNGGVDGAVGVGAGYYQIPSGDRIVGLARIKPGLTVVFRSTYSAGMRSLTYEEYDDNGQAVTSGTIGSPNHMFVDGPAQVISVYPGGQTVMLPGQEESTGNAALASVDISNNGTVTPGPCGLFTSFSSLNSFRPGTLGVDRTTGQLALAGVQPRAPNGDWEPAIAVTNANCTQAPTGTYPIGTQTAVGDGLSAYGTTIVDGVVGDGAGDWFVAETLPVAPGSGPYAANQTAGLLLKVTSNGTLAPGFTTYRAAGRNSTSSTTMVAAVADGPDIVGLGADQNGVAPNPSFAGFLTSGAGTLDPSVNGGSPATISPANDPTGNVSVIGAQEPTAGTLVVESNDFTSQQRPGDPIGPSPGFTVINITPAGG
jgi:hypothetical protein